MAQLLVGFPLARGARLSKKVGGPTLPRKPAPEPAYLTPGQKKRRLDAAYLERFFAREQRRLATGILLANERTTLKIPAKGRIRPIIARSLGLIPHSSSSDPEATHWIPSAPIGNLQFSPFLPRPRLPGPQRYPNLSKPLISGFKYRRLWHAARRQGLDHLLPPGPSGLAETFVLAETKRAAAVNETSELLSLARQHFAKSPVATEKEVDGAMRRFAVRLPKYEHVKKPALLFPYHRLRQAKKAKRARQIHRAMEEMPAKVAAYREAVAEEKRRARRVSPL